MFIENYLKDNDLLGDQFSMDEIYECFVTEQFVS